MSQLTKFQIQIQKTDPDSVKKGSMDDINSNL